MLFIVIGTDGPDAAERRRAHLDAHLEWVLTAMDRLRVAGPVRNTPGGAPCMSIYILEAIDEADARALVGSDPYFKAGVWQTVEFRLFSAAAGTWVGGATWKR
ncbi:MAG: YciI family protein [Steroidobacteraceae bacterium]|jgi:hypothetical protein|nr:YciI family protein [Steroidobacteraceae bacterium]